MNYDQYEYGKLNALLNEIIDARFTEIADHIEDLGEDFETSDDLLEEIKCLYESDYIDQVGNIICEILKEKFKMEHAIMDDQ